MNDEEGPEFEVWNHLESGWQMAWDDMAKQLGDRDVMQFFEDAAAIIVGSTSALHLDPTLAPVRKKLEAFLPGLESGKYEVVLKAVLESYHEGPNPWLRHAVELELARAGLDRATEAFDRFKVLVPQLRQRPLPARAEPYIREAIQAFLFGFDAACIALCRSGVEQVAKEVLVRIGVYTEPYLKRSAPPLETLLTNLKQSGALVGAFGAADRVRDRGNTVLHKHLYDQKVRRQLALDCVVDLAAVLREALP